MEKVGWALVIIGGLLQAAETAAKTSATLNNTLFSQSTIGALVAPIEQFTPLPLGWTLVTAGSVVLLFHQGARA